MKMYFISVVFLMTMLGSASACDGHFETREQTICICEGHYERFWDGRCWVSYYAPPRYESRLVQIWIPERHGGGSLNFKINWNWRTW